MFLYYFFLISSHDDVKCWFFFISLADAVFFFFLSIVACYLPDCFLVSDVHPSWCINALRYLEGKDYMGFKLLIAADQLAFRLTLRVASLTAFFLRALWIYWEDIKKKGEDYLQFKLLICKLCYVCISSIYDSWASHQLSQKSNQLNNPDYLFVKWISSSLFLIMLFILGK